MKTLTTILCCLFAVPAFAVNYYIDFAGGDDSNDGLTTSTPWKRSPGMAGFTGTHTWAAGDNFIFKGGVVWSDPVYVGSKTGTEEAPIVYRADTNYFAGASWTRPVIDMLGQVPPQGFSTHVSSLGNVFWIVSSSYIFVYDIQIQGIRWYNPISNDSDCNAVYMFSSGGCVVSNTLIQAHHVRTSTDGKWGGIANDSSTAPNYAFNNRIKGANVLLDPDALVYVSDTRCSTNGFCTAGAGLRNMPFAQGNHISGTTQGIWGGKTIRFNIIGDAVDVTCDSYSASSHENGTWLMNDGEWHGNIMFNCRSGVGAYFRPYWSTENNRQLVYDNIFYGVQQIVLSTEDGVSNHPTGTNSDIYFFNNVVDRTDGVYQFGNSSLFPFQDAVNVNNLIISRDLDSTLTSQYYGSDNWPAKFVSYIGVNPPGLNWTNSNNLYMSRTEAAARGLTFDRLYRPFTNDYAPPTDNGIATAQGGGVNMAALISSFSGAENTDRLGDTRPADGGGAWDIGPYILQDFLQIEEPQSAPVIAFNPNETDGVTHNSIAIVWTYGASDHDGFRVYLRTAVDGTRVPQGVTGTGELTYTISGLAAGTQYWVDVVAYNSFGEGAASNTLATETDTIVAGPNPAKGANGGTNSNNRRR